MDNRNTISVRMNGKETSINQQHNKEIEATALDEQAATLEHDFNPEDLIEYEKLDSSSSKEPWFNRKRKRRLPPGFKPFIIAAASATVIGITLGFIMLRMFAGIGDDGQAMTEPLGTTPSNTPSGTEQNTPSAASNGEMASYTLASLSAWVIQTGTFNGEKGASDNQELFANANFPTILWDNAEDYRVFAGVSSTKQDADSSAQAMVEQGLDIYVREWQTTETEINIDANATTWLDGFTTHWQQSLTALASENSLTSVSGNWESWLANYPETENEQLDAINQAASQLLEGIKNEASVHQLQIDLLNVWHNYYLLSK